MIDHVSIGIADIDRARKFYDVVLATLGYSRQMDFPEACGYGPAPDKPMFWIGRPSSPPTGTVMPAPGMHIAFMAPDRAAVEAFHRAALAEGGTDNGAPGFRPHYHPNYFAAFVIDLDGHRIEAVCHCRA